MIKSSGRLIRPQTTVFHTKELVTQTSVVITRCVLVVKTKDHIALEFNHLHKNTITVKCQIVIGNNTGINYSNKLFVEI